MILYSSSDLAISYLASIALCNALKITDGGTRGAEGAITALLVKLGVLDAGHPAAKKRLDAVQKNWRGTETGILQRAPGFP